MISDTQTSITSSDPHFPSEIIDLIFDFALPGLDPRSISSVAHASHHFRTLANHQRFSSTSFVYNDTKRIPTNVKMRICKFAELIQTGRQITTMRGIQTFISSFTLEVGIGSDFLNFTKLGYLSVIFDNLFRDPGITCEPVRMLSLEIAPDQPFRDWKKDGNTLLESLWSLIRTPYLNELRILRGSGIPLNLILGSNIEHLHVGDLVMFDDEIVELKQVSRPVELKSLWLDVWPDSNLENYLQLICGTSDPPPERFSDLTDLVVYNGSNVFISRILGLTKSLKTLTLGHRYNPSGPSAKMSIPCNRLPFLKSLHIKSESDHFSNITNESEPLKMLGCFGMTPLLETLTISLISTIKDTDLLYRRNGRWLYSDETGGHLFDHKRGNVWDKHLASLPLKDTTAVEVALHLTHLNGSPLISNGHLWGDQWKEHFITSFSQCAATYRNFRVSFHYSIKKDDRFSIAGYYMAAF